MIWFDALEPAFPERDDEQSREATCKRCGKTGLEWVDCGGAPIRWRLYDPDRYELGKVVRGRVHVCSEKVMQAQAADDFEAVT